MPRQNRVLPSGEIVAQPWRGAFMGNRGILHDDEGNLGTTRWKSSKWICCVTERPKGKRKRKVMQPGHYTELFFWDEACALAAGHRPCGECRRDDWERFKAAWTEAGLRGRTALQIDRVLHVARVTRDRRQKAHQANLSTLPDGTFAAWLTAENVPLLKWRGRLWAWSPSGYRDAGPSGTGMVRVMTPAPIVAALRAGYMPQVRLPEGEGAR